MESAKLKFITPDAKNKALKNQKYVGDIETSLLRSTNIVDHQNTSNTTFAPVKMESYLTGHCAKVITER